MDELQAFRDIALHLNNPLVLLGFALLLMFLTQRSLSRTPSGKSLAQALSQRTSGKAFLTA